jgi:hypothetical protein
MECIDSQSFRDFTVVLCINQPDEWWEQPRKKVICENNLSALRDFARWNRFPVHIIDKCSPGKGWKGKRHGVGWARKTAMDFIAETAEGNDIILSLDADTTFPPTYFASVSAAFHQHPAAASLCIPYFHLPVNDPAAYRAILRYEIYMRHFVINLWRTGSPYSFTALGSAMACPVWAYRAVGGLTPKLSGEDFYFLQKLRKFGDMLFWNGVKVHPAARFSDRVYFGTGPAMIRGAQGDWSSYPIYPARFFDEIEQTCALFPVLFHEPVQTPLTEFLQVIFNEEDPWEPLRINFPDPLRFIRACHEKFDGLRILQDLKRRHKSAIRTDEEELIEFLDRFYPEEMRMMKVDFRAFSFKESAIADLEKIRTFLATCEDASRISSIPG